MILDEISTALRGRRVLVTGHSGFKGGWLTLWLARLGADVIGLSLPSDQGPDSLHGRAGVAEACREYLRDIRDMATVQAVFEVERPEVVFHLAAQPLVRRSYADPVGTFATNVMGTAHVLEAARNAPSVRAVVCVTTDKVYDNREWLWPYRETDPLGGKDPYSASKSAAEMVARSYMTALSTEGSFRMATARGGNVVGGGDWSEDRIVPDIVRALRAGTPLLLRHPGAVRPWQHVLELCLGYLVLAARLVDGRADRSQAPEHFVGTYNFGPDPSSEQPVGDLVRQMLTVFGTAGHAVELGVSTVHEANYLKLDSSQARASLGWRPLLDFNMTMAWTGEWYRLYAADPHAARALTEAQIDAYSALCETLH